MPYNILIGTVWIIKPCYSQNLQMAKDIWRLVFHFDSLLCLTGWIWARQQAELSAISVPCLISTSTGAERNWTRTHVALSFFVTDRLPAHLCDLMCFRLVATKSGCAWVEFQKKRGVKLGSGNAEGVRTLRTVCCQSSQNTLKVTDNTRALCQQVDLQNVLTFAGN